MVKPAPWRNGKKRDEAIANYGLPYGMPLYHVRVPDYRATDKVLAELDRDMRTIGEKGFITTPEDIEISIINPVWPALIGGNAKLSEIGRECLEAELEEAARHNNRIWHATQGSYYGKKMPRLDLLPQQLACGFHVSVLDPYPEGA